MRRWLRRLWWFRPLDGHGSSDCRWRCSRVWHSPGVEPSPGVRQGRKPSPLRLTPAAQAQASLPSLEGGVGVDVRRWRLQTA